jgi:hypothetical protein
MATEMVLIPKAAYERWAREQSQGQSITDVERNQHDVKSDVMTTQDLSTSSKAGDTTRTIEGSEKTKETPTVESVQKDNKGEHQDIKAIIETFPKNYRLYAKRLLIYIRKNGPNILEWSDTDKTVIYRGEVVNGSDINELINYIFKTNAPKPTGLDTFRKGMTEINVPQAYLKPYLLKPPGVSKTIKKKWVKY